MRPLLNRIVLLCSATLSLAAVAGAPREAERDALRAAMQSVIEKSTLKSARVTVQVRSLDDGTVVFAKDPDELLNPASNVKLYTAAAALVRLGTEYRFETEFFTDQEFKNGIAKTLYIRGKGDPTITTERLYGMVSELVHAGLKELGGDIVVDDSWFDAERAAPGFDQEYGDKAYLAPTGASAPNRNTVGVFLRPGETIGAKASVELEPSSDYFVLEADVTTGTKTQRRYNVGSALDKDRQHQKIDAEGVVPFEKGSWSAWKKIDQPSLYFGYTVKELLKQRGIKVKGRVRQGVVPSGQKMMTSPSQTRSMWCSRNCKSTRRTSWPSSSSRRSALKVAAHQEATRKASTSSKIFSRKTLGWRGVRTSCAMAQGSTTPTDSLRLRRRGCW